MNIITENIDDIISIDSSKFLFNELKKKIINSDFNLVSEFESKKSNEKIAMFFNKIDTNFRCFIVEKDGSIAISKMEAEDFNLNFELTFDFDKIDLNKEKTRIIEESLISFQNAFLHKDEKCLTIWPTIFSSDEEYIVELKHENTYILNLSNENIKLDLKISNGVLENKSEGEFSDINDLQELRDMITLKTDYDFMLPYKIIDSIQKKSNKINNRFKNGI